MDYFNKLNKVVSEISPFTVDEEFIRYRTIMRDKFRANGRSDQKRDLHADCLVVEYNLLNMGMAEPPTSKHNDFIIDGRLKVDSKILSSQSFTIPRDKIGWYRKGINEKELTHFGFFRYDKVRSIPSKVGTKLNFHLLELVAAEEVMRLLRPSKFDDSYYYIVKNFNKI